MSRKFANIFFLLQRKIDKKKIRNKKKFEDTFLGPGGQNCFSPGERNFYCHFLFIFRLIQIKEDISPQAEAQKKTVSTLFLLSPIFGLRSTFSDALRQVRIPISK